MKIKAIDLDWYTAHGAAVRVVQICEDARFTAPELMGARLAEIAVEMSRIATALHLVTPDGAS